MTIEANRKAKEYAEIYNDWPTPEGRTWARVSRMVGLSYAAVNWTMANACPPFRTIPTIKGRPWWSFPDQITLALARQGRIEISHADAEAS